LGKTNFKMVDGRQKGQSVKRLSINSIGRQGNDLKVVWNPG